MRLCATSQVCCVSNRDLQDIEKPPQETAGAFCVSGLEDPELFAWQRPDEHDHLAAFHLREVFNAANLFGVFGNAFKQLAAKVLVGHLTAAEPQRDLYLVPIVEELEHVTHLDVIVIGIGVRAELDLFDLDDLLLLARFGFTLLRLILEFAKVHDLAHGRVGIGRNLDQIKSGINSHFHGAIRCHDADVFPIRTDQADFVGADVFVDARAGVSLRRRVMRSASDDGRPLIVVLMSSTEGKPAHGLLQVAKWRIYRVKPRIFGGFTQGEAAYRAFDAMCWHIVCAAGD